MGGKFSKKKEYTVNDSENQEPEGATESSCVSKEIGEQKTQDEAAPPHASEESEQQKSQAVTVEATKNAEEQKLQDVAVEASAVVAPLHENKEIEEPKTQAVSCETVAPVCASREAELKTQDASKESEEWKCQAAAVEASEIAPSCATKKAEEQKSQDAAIKASAVVAPLHENKEIERKTQAVSCETVAPVCASREAEELETQDASKESEEWKSQAVAVEASEIAPLCATKKAEEQKSQDAAIKASAVVAPLHENKEIEQKTQAVHYETVAPSCTSREAEELKTQDASQEAEEKKMQDAVESSEAVTSMGGSGAVEGQKARNATVVNETTAEEESVNKTSVPRDRIEADAHNEAKSMKIISPKEQFLTKQTKVSEDLTNYETKSKKKENVKSVEPAIDIKLIQHDQREYEGHFDSTSPEKTLVTEEAWLAGRKSADTSTDVAGVTCMDTEYAEQVLEQLGEGAMNDNEENKPFLATDTFENDLLSRAVKEIEEASLDLSTSNFGPLLGTEESVKLSCTKLLPSEVNVTAELDDASEMVHISKEEPSYQKDESLIASPTKLHQQSDCNNLFKSELEATIEQKLEHLCSSPENLMAGETMAEYVYICSEQVKEKEPMEEVTGNEMLVTTDVSLTTTSSEPPLQGKELCAGKTAELQSQENAFNTFEELGSLDAKGNLPLFQIYELDSNQTDLAKEKTSSACPFEKDSILLDLRDSSVKPSSPSNVSYETQSLHMIALKSDAFPDRAAETKSNSTVHLEHKEIKNEKSVLFSNMDEETSALKFESVGEKLNPAHPKEIECLTNMMDFGGKVDKKVIAKIQDKNVENQLSVLDAIQESVQKCASPEKHSSKDEFFKKQTEAFSIPNIQSNVTSEMEFEGNLPMGSSTGKNVNDLIETITAEVIQASNERELSTEPHTHKLENYGCALSIDRELGKKEMVMDTEKITQKARVVFAADNLLDREIVVTDKELDRAEMAGVQSGTEICGAGLEVKMNLTEEAGSTMNHEETDTGACEVNQEKMSITETKAEFDFERNHSK